MEGVRHVGFTALCLVPCSQFSGLRFGEVLLALQGSVHMHVGKDNLNVVDHVGRVIAGGRTGRPFPLDNDGDLLLLDHLLVQCRRQGSTQITKVQGHADEGMIALGRAREVDRMGNNEADRSRRRVHCHITGARRLVNGACARWYPIVQELHGFFVAIARAVVNSDDLVATSLHPVVWSSAANPKRRRVDRAVRNVTWLPGPAWTSDWTRMHVAGLTAADVNIWLVGAGDLGVGGVSYRKLLFLYERWAGERLVLEKAVPFRRRAGRPISVSLVPVGPGIDIWRSCRFLGCTLRFLSRLLGGLRRFMLCGTGANHCRLRHISWEKCGHGLTSRPRETSDFGFLDSLLQVFSYPGGSGALLLAGWRAAFDVL